MIGVRGLLHHRVLMVLVAVVEDVEVKQEVVLVGILGFLLYRKRQPRVVPVVKGQTV